MTVGQPFSPYRIFTGPVIPECLIPYQKISWGAKMLLAMINRYIGKRDDSWPGQDRLADEMGVSVRTIGGYIAELVDDGFIEVERRGLGKTNRYRAIWHPLFEDPDSEPSKQDPAEPTSQGVSDPLHLLSEESQTSNESTTGPSQETSGEDPEPNNAYSNPWEVADRTVGEIHRTVRGSKLPFAMKKLWAEMISENPIQDPEAFRVEVTQFFRNPRYKRDKWHPRLFWKPRTADASIPSRISGSGSPNAPAAQNGAARGLESPLPESVSRSLCAEYDNFVDLWRSPCDGCGQEFPLMKVERGKQEWCALVGSGGISEGTLPLVIEGLKRYRASHSWHEDACKYVPAVASFLASTRWTDRPKAFNHAIRDKPKTSGVRQMMEEARERERLEASRATQ